MNKIVWNNKTVDDENGFDRTDDCMAAHCVHTERSRLARNQKQVEEIFE